MKLRRVFYVLLILLVIITGCSQNTSAKQYKEFAHKFNDIYFETVECIDLSDTVDSLKKLQEDKYQRNIEELGTLLENIRKTIPESRKKVYGNFEKRYKDLFSLSKKYLEIDNLSREEREEIDRIFISIGVWKKNWEDKNSSIAWY